MRNGLFIVLDGIEASVVTDQLTLLVERLRTVGHEVEIFNFPQYDKPSSHFIRQYSGDEYGSSSSISPYTASVFYALDHFDASSSIENALFEGKIVLANRFAGSSMADQGSKFTNLAERRGFFLWEDGFEFQLLGIPRPTLNLFLHVPAEISYDLISKKNARSYASKALGEHEGNINHLRSSVEAYEQLCKLFPKDFTMIECAEDNRILDIPTINNLIWGAIKPLLPEKTQHKPQGKIVKLGNQPKSGAARSPSMIVGAQIRHDRVILSVKNISLLAQRNLFTFFSVNNTVQPANVAGKYYRPNGLSTKLAQLYNQTLHSDIVAYRKLAKKVPAPIAQAILPLSYMASFDLSSDTAGWKNALTGMSCSPLDEIRELAKHLAARLKRAQPKAFKGFELLSKTLDITQVANIANSLSSTISEGGTKTVSLTEWAPRNELDLLEDIVYSNTDLPKEEISKRIGNLPFAQKNETLLAYLVALPANQTGVLDEVRYCLDLVTDSVTIIGLLSTNLFDQVRVQTATPRYGYDVPSVIEEAGLEDMYIKCFDESLRLHSELYAAGFTDQAQYAVLAGHKVRWQARLSAKSAMELKTIVATQLPDHQKTVAQILEKISEVHPTIHGFIDHILM